VSPRLFALIPAAVAINLVIGRLVAELALPFYLDTLGTMLVAILTGLPGGLLVGTISQLLAGMLSGYQWLAFVPIQWLIAALAAGAARNREARSGNAIDQRAGGSGEISRRCPLRSRTRLYRWKSPRSGARSASSITIAGEDAARSVSWATLLPSRSAPAAAS
jgi:predicted lipid-binding transport protein (Tim44 family)